MNCIILLVSGSEDGEHGKSSNSVEVCPEVKQTESRQSVMGKTKHGQDFIKKNIEVPFVRNNMYDKRFMSNV